MTTPMPNAALKAVVEKVHKCAEPTATPSVTFVPEEDAVQCACGEKFYGWQLPQFADAIRTARAQ